MSCCLLIAQQERANFMKMFGYGFEERYIDGKEFMDRIEFGVE